MSHPALPYFDIKHSLYIELMTAAAVYLTRCLLYALHVQVYETIKYIAQVSFTAYPDNCHRAHDLVSFTVYPEYKA